MLLGIVEWQKSFSVLFHLRGCLPSYPRGKQELFVFGEVKIVVSGLNYNSSFSHTSTNKHSGVGLISRSSLGYLYQRHCFFCCNILL